MRARPTAWRWPPERLRPRSPTSICSPPVGLDEFDQAHFGHDGKDGRLRYLVHPMMMFSRRLPVKSSGSCGTKPTPALSSAGS